MDLFDEKLCPEIRRVKKMLAPSLCLLFWLGDGFCLRVLFTNWALGIHRYVMFIMGFVEGWVKARLP